MFLGPPFTEASVEYLNSINILHTKKGCFAVHEKGFKCTRSKKANEDAMTHLIQVMRISEIYWMHKQWRGGLMPTWKSSSFIISQKYTFLSTVYSYWWKECTMYISFFDYNKTYLSSIAHHSLKYIINCSQVLYSVLLHFISQKRGKIYHNTVVLKLTLLLSKCDDSQVSINS